MTGQRTRRQFLADLGSAAAAASVSSTPWAAAALAGPERPCPRVAIARDDALARGNIDEHYLLLRRLLDAAVQKVTGAPTAAAAWRGLFRPSERIGIKVNTLGLSTQPGVAAAIAEGLQSGDVPAENIVIWDRFDVELAQAGFRLNKSSRGVRCYGTDSEEIGGGYQSRIETSGAIGSCFSKIVAEQVDALICVPVLKDHNLAGVSLGLKNFYGAIHNPNKYHDNNCDPYVADVVSHRFIGSKWRLTVCDATRAQYHGGPSPHPGFAWPFGGLIVGTDFVATDAVAADLLEAERKAKGLQPLGAEKRPTRHIASAGARGLGEADLSGIDRIEV